MSEPPRERLQEPASREQLGIMLAQRDHAVSDGGVIMGACEHVGFAAGVDLYLDAVAADVPLGLKPTIRQREELWGELRSRP